MKIITLFLLFNAPFILTGCLPSIGVDVPIGKHAGIDISTGGVGVDIPIGKHGDIDIGTGGIGIGVHE